MKKRSISIVIGLIIGAIMAVFVVDFLNERPGKSGANPYEYNVDEYKAVNKELIHYKETRNFPIKDFSPRGMAVSQDKIWLIGDGLLQVIGMNGRQILKTTTTPRAECITVTKEAIYIGYKEQVQKYSLDGNLIAEWDALGSKSVITSLAAGDNLLYVADAGNRRVLLYNFDGDLKGEFSGKAESSAGHGFIVPSANFDLAVNSAGELWVVNPGKHALENYNDNGDLLNSWQNSSMKIEGFTGCCNPAEFTTLQDDLFVTSEKGMVRIKVYDRSGKMLSVVAAPEKFDEEGHAPEVAADEKGVIYALDFDRSMIRVFEKI